MPLVEDEGEGLAVLRIDALLLELADEHDGVGVGAVRDERLVAVQDVAAVAVAARVDFMLPKASEPEPGSVIAQAPILSMRQQVESPSAPSAAVVPLDMIA